MLPLHQTITLNSNPMLRNITLSIFLIGALLCPSLTKGQAYQLSKVSGTRDKKEEIYKYYYTDRILDSITTQQGGRWMLKEVPKYDASKRLVQLDEWQFSSYKKQWYLANHYDYKYNDKGLLKMYTKSVYYGTDYNALEDHEYSYDNQGRKKSVEVYDYSKDMTIRRLDYSYNEQGLVSRVSDYKSVSSDGLAEAIRSDYSYTAEGQLSEVKVYTLQGSTLKLDKTKRYQYDADGACSKMELFEVGIDFPTAIYNYTSDKSLLQADCLPYGFPQSYFPEVPVDRYARLSEQILLLDINKKENEHANYTYSYERLEAPATDNIVSWTTTLQSGTKGHIGVASTEAFEIDWGDGNFISYQAGDFAQITKRKEGTIKGQQIRIKGNPQSITKLNLAQQGVSEIDLKALTALKELYLTENKLSAIDLSKQTALQQLYIDKNSLSALDLSAQKKLTLLRANVNKLSTLDLSHNSQLKNLVLSDNELSQLNVQNLTNLEELQADQNKLTELDITKNVKLTDLDLDFNQLTSLDLQHNAELTWLYLESNKIATIDLSALKALRNLNLASNALTTIDLSHNTSLIELILNGNKIGQVDITPNTSISRLHVSACGLSTLDISKQKRLSTLEANDNMLTTIDLKINDRLKILELSSNKLQTIDLSKNVKLTKLYLDNNQFAQLSLSGLSKLIIVSLHHNLLDADQLNAIYAALPDLSAIAVDPNIKDHKKLFVYETPGAATAHHATATEKGWLVESKTPEGVGITLTTADDGIKLYPNPATDYLCVEGAKAHTSMVLYTFDGQVVLQAETDAQGAARLALVGLPNGYYYLQIADRMHKIIVAQ